MRSTRSSSKVIQGLLLGDRDFNNTDELILRDHLALVRSRLALKHCGDLRWVGIASLVLCILFVLIGLYRYHTLRRHLDLYIGARMPRPKVDPPA